MINYEKVIKDIGDKNTEELKKDNVEMAQELRDLDTVGKLAEYLNTLDPSKKVYIADGSIRTIIRPCDIVEKDEEILIG